MAKNSFKLSNPLEMRVAESTRIRAKYPDRIPVCFLIRNRMQVIVEKAGQSDVPDIDKNKYLVPADLTVGQFVYVVRIRTKLGSEKAIFVFVKNTLPPTAALMSAIYEEHNDEDGFYLHDIQWREHIWIRLLISSSASTVDVPLDDCTVVSPLAFSSGSSTLLMAFTFSGFVF